MSAKQQEIGFTKAELTKFTSTLDGKKPTFYRQAELYFNSMDDAQEGHGHGGLQEGGRRPHQLRRPAASRHDRGRDRRARARPALPRRS